MRAISVQCFNLLTTSLEKVEGPLIYCPKTKLATDPQENASPYSCSEILKHKAPVNMQFAVRLHQ